MSIGNSGRDLVMCMLLLPVLEWLCSSAKIVGRPPNLQKGVMIAASFLAIFSAVKIGYEVALKEPSYYDTLEVVPGAAHAELKKGYKQASLKVHPDKLQAQRNAGGGEAADDEPPSDEAFLAVKAAYEVLSDTQLRDLYDKFGKAGIAKKDDTTSLLTGLGFFYVVWLALAYLLTRRKQVCRAQTWSFSGLLALAIFEYQATVQGFDFLQQQLPQLTMFEKVELLHRLYPVYLLGARLVALLFFQDIDAHNFVMLQHLHWKIDRLRERLFIHNNGAPACPPGVVPYASPELWTQFAQQTEHYYKLLQQQQPCRTATADTAAGQLPDAEDGTLAFGQLNADAIDAPFASDPTAPPVLRAAPAPAARGGGRQISGLIWFFGVYFFFQWLLGRSG